MVSFLVHKIFTFYINGVLNCKCPAPGPKGCFQRTELARSTLWVGCWLGDKVSYRCPATDFFLLQRPQNRLWIPSSLLSSGNQEVCHLWYIGRGKAHHFHLLTTIKIHGSLPPLRHYTLRHTQATLYPPSVFIILTPSAVTAVLPTLPIIWAAWSDGVQGVQEGCSV